MNRQDYSGLIDACLRLGDASRGGDPQLWTVVLEHLTKQESDVTPQVRSPSIQLIATFSCHLYLESPQKSIPAEDVHNI